MAASASSSALGHLRGPPEPGRVEIVDYETDRGRHGEPEYRKQLSVYHHVASEVYPDREIGASILYTASGSRQRIEPLGVDELRELIRESEPMSTGDTERGID